jgi:hypothetical protein
VGATLRIRIQESSSGVLAQKFSFEEEKQNTSVGGETYGDRFLDAGGVIHVDFLELGTTIISERYIATLINLKQQFATIRSKEKVLLQYDNAKPHASSAAVEDTARLNLAILLNLYPANVENRVSS